MLVLGVGAVLASIYLLTIGDGSWKWMVGIPDGLFAAVTGVLVILAARRSARRDQGHGDGGDSLASPDRPHPLAGRRLDRDGSSEHLPQSVLDHPPVRS